jgi:hypothetical protein
MRPATVAGIPRPAWLISRCSAARWAPRRPIRRPGGSVGMPLGDENPGAVTAQAAYNSVGAVSFSRTFAHRVDCHRAPVAQWIEQRTSNPKVAGSNPAGRTTILPGQRACPSRAIVATEARTAIRTAISRTDDGSPRRPPPARSRAARARKCSSSDRSGCVRASSSQCGARHPRRAGTWRTRAGGRAVGASRGRRRADPVPGAVQVCLARSGCRSGT